MNKSLAIRNKIYRFCFLLISFFLFLYFLYFLINAERGIISYYKLINKHSYIEKDLILLEQNNKILEDRISRLSPNTVDLEYLDEQLRIKTGRNTKNEIIINLNN